MKKDTTASKTPMRGRQWAPASTLVIPTFSGAVAISPNAPPLPFPASPQRLTNGHTTVVACPLVRRWGDAGNGNGGALGEMATAPEKVGITKVLAGAHWRPRIGVLLAVVSFFIYSILVISLPQVRDTPYACEQSSFAAAVSNIVYGSRVGSMYTGVFDMFTTHFTEPLPQTLEEIRAELPAQPVGELSPTTIDGNGVGYPLVATAAFRLFGFHWWAPIAVMLILMAASMAAFLRRFPPNLVTLYFSGLTAMLFSVWIWDPTVRLGIPIGGIRYFSLVGILPTFHILLSIMERQPFRAAAPLAVQTMILIVAA